MTNARILIIKSGGGTVCEHAMRGHNNEDIAVLCEKCSDELPAGVKIPGTMTAIGKRLEYVCSHAFQLIQLPFEDGRAKWFQQGNTLLCVDCAKKDEVLK
jgi:hypothetical protein